MIRYLACYLVLASQAFAQEPAFEVKGPTDVKAGGSFILRATVPAGVNADKVQWRISPEPASFDFDRSFDGSYKLTVLDADEATYQTTIVGAYLDAEGKPAPLLTLWSVKAGGGTPKPPTPAPKPADPAAPTAPTIDDKATAATYVYEKDQHPVPSYVLAALNRLNRDRKIVATLFEADTKDGTGEVPDQHKAALAAAKQAGLPALVVTAGDKVVSVVKAPKDEQALLDAVP